MTVICLPMPPSTNHLFAGRGRRYRSPEYKAWTIEAGLQLNRQHPASVLGLVSLLIEVAEPKTKRAQDITNRIKAVEDLLVSHGVIQGDDQRYVRRVTAEWADIEGARVTVTPL
jgi:crossover junction endodeoxyribonuclease RusA